MLVMFDQDKVAFPPISQIFGELHPGEEKKVRAPEELDWFK
jgi:hypothetical protein